MSAANGPPPLVEKDMKWLELLAAAGSAGLLWAVAPARFDKLETRGLVLGITISACVRRDR